MDTMKKILLIIVAGLLQGCVAGAFVAGGAASGSMVSDNRSFQTMEKDNSISYQAQRYLAADATLKNQAHIVVATYNSVMLLAGQAPTEALRQQAVTDVKQVPNVRRIFNEITIAKPSSAVVQSQDAAITANVKTRMMTTTNLKSSQFKVVTENHTVFLMGLSTPKQAGIAAAVARNSTGVQRVVKLVEYASPEDE